MRIAACLFAALLIVSLSGAGPAVAKGGKYKVVDVKNGGRVGGTCKLSRLVTVPKLWVIDHKNRGRGAAIGAAIIITTFVKRRSQRQPSNIAS